VFGGFASLAGIALNRCGGSSKSIRIGNSALQLAFEQNPEAFQVCCEQVKGDVEFTAGLASHNQIDRPLYLLINSAYV
jgi:hypothetical protein